MTKISLCLIGNEMTRTFFEVIPPVIYPQRKLFLSSWRGGGGEPTRKQFFVLLAMRRWKLLFEGRLYPQFCSKLLYIYYKLWGIIWLNKSKISHCQQDEENFYIPCLDWIGSARVSFLNRWMKNHGTRAKGCGAR